MKTFFIADMHFDDSDIMNYENRPFESVKEMNEAIVANWNRVVGDDDVVYVLGDIGNIFYIQNLKGKKYLVKGNHDTKDNSFYRESGFVEVYDLPVIYEDFWMLSHEPKYVNRNMPYANIYGHVHGNPNYCSVSNHGFCVSVERIDYTPVELKSIQNAILNAKVSD